MMPADPAFRQQPQALPFIDWDHLPVPRTLFAASTGASFLLLKGTGLITCITMANAITTSSSSYNLYDGTDQTGQIIATMITPAAAGYAITPGPPGIPFRTGLFLHHVTGFASFTITYIPLLDPLP